MVFGLWRLVYVFFFLKHFSTTSIKFLLWKAVKSNYCNLMQLQFVSNDLGKHVKYLTSTFHFVYFRLKHYFHCSEGRLFPLTTKRCFNGKTKTCCKQNHNKTHKRIQIQNTHHMSFQYCLQTSPLDVSFPPEVEGAPCTFASRPGTRLARQSTIKLPRKDHTTQQLQMHITW